jgi:lysozyme
MSTDAHHEDDLAMKQAWWDRFHDLKLADSKEQLEKIIKEHEGVEHYAYPDSKGNITVGVGFNMDQPGAKTVFDALGIPFEPVHSGKAQLTSEQIDALLNHSISGAIEDLKSIFPKFDQLSAGRQMALADMMFMGKPKFEGFVEMIGAVKAGDWDKAAKEMGKSLWAEKQVQETRSGPDMEAMRTGNYPGAGKAETALHSEAGTAPRGGVPDAGAHPGSPAPPRPDTAPAPQPGSASPIPGGDKISPPQGRLDLLQNSGKPIAPASDPVLAKALAAYEGLIQTSRTLAPTQVPGREMPSGQGNILPGGSPGAVPPSTGPGQNSPLPASPLADKTPAGQVQPPGLGGSAPSSSSQGGQGSGSGGGQGSGSGGGQGSNVAGDPVLAKALAAAGPIASVQVQPEVKPVVTPVPAGPLLS